MARLDESYGLAGPVLLAMAGVMAVILASPLVLLLL